LSSITTASAESLSKDDARCRLINITHFFKAASNSVGCITEMIKQFDNSPEEPTHIKLQKSLTLCMPHTHTPPTPCKFARKIMCKHINYSLTPSVDTTTVNPLQFTRYG